MPVTVTCGPKRKPPTVETYVGSTYPLPGFVIATLVILPSITVGVNIAVILLAIPTKLRSSYVSIFTSYVRELASGAGSLLVKSLILNSSTII